MFTDYNNVHPPYMTNYPLLGRTMSLRLFARFHTIGVTAVARREAKAHCLQVNGLRIMRAGNNKGLGDPNVKGVLLKLAHPRRDIYGTGRE